MRIIIVNLWKKSTRIWLEIMKTIIKYCKNITNWIIGRIIIPKDIIYRELHALHYFAWCICRVDIASRSREISISVRWIEFKRVVARVMVIVNLVDRARYNSPSVLAIFHLCTQDLSYTEMLRIGRSLDWLMTDRDRQSITKPFVRKISSNSGFRVEYSSVDLMGAASMRRGIGIRYRKMINIAWIEKYPFEFSVWNIRFNDQNIAIVIYRCWKWVKSGSCVCIFLYVLFTLKLRVSCSNFSAKTPWFSQFLFTLTISDETNDEFQFQ